MYIVQHGINIFIQTTIITTNYKMHTISNKGMYILMNNSLNKNKYVSITRIQEMYII